MSKAIAKLINSFMYVFVGAERSGKSFLAKHILNLYAKVRGTALVYNFGKSSDFPSNEYFTIEPLTFDEHIQQYYNTKDAKSNYKLNKTIEYFRCNGQVYHMRDFSKLFWKKKVRMFRIENRVEETAFFKSVYKYISRTLIVFDDCKVTFKYGLNDGHVQLFSRKNHTGNLNSIKSLRGKGVDVICIFHNIDHVNGEIWDFTTGLTQFYFPMKPKYKKMENEQLERISSLVYEHLKTADKYTAIEIPIQGENAFKIKDVTLKTA